MANFGFQRVSSTLDKVCLIRDKERPQPPPDSASIAQPSSSSSPSSSRQRQFYTQFRQLQPESSTNITTSNITDKFRTNLHCLYQKRTKKKKKRRRKTPNFECFNLFSSPSLISLPLCLMFLLLLPLILLLVTQKCMCLDHQPSYQPLLSMEPATSIFGSLLGSNNNNNNNNNVNINNMNSGNSATQLQQGPQSAADLHQSYKDGQTSDKVTLPGDILLGGLFPIHMKGTKVECGEINRDRGIQRLEAMLYALDRINEDSRLLPGIKLGAILLDSCSSSTYALNQSLEFIRASINTVESSAFECKDKSTPRPKYGSKMIAGVIGGSYSEVSLQVANLLRLFRIPQVSYASTGTALSDKTLYDLFARTVPSDMFQARAIADIVLKLNWSYVSLVSSEGLYGDSGSKEFMKQASVRRICIATHEKISPTTDNNAYDSIVANLEKRNATGVVLFTRAEDTRELLLAVKRAKLFHNFAWVAADGWGTHQKLVEGVEEVAWGAITVELQAKAIPGFDQYMKALTPWANGRNPWFSEYWQEWFDCQLQANLIKQQEVASGLAYSRRHVSSTDSAVDEGPFSNDAWRPNDYLSESAPASASSQDNDADDFSEPKKRRRSVSSNCGHQTSDGSNNNDSSNNNNDNKTSDNNPSKMPSSSSVCASMNNKTNSKQKQVQQQEQQVRHGHDKITNNNIEKSLQHLTSSSSSSSLSTPANMQPNSDKITEHVRSKERVKRMANDLSASLKQFCSPNLRISESNGYRQEQKVQFVVDAVYAMAHALHKAWHNLCDAQYGTVCEALKELNGGDFYAKYLLNVSFKDLAGSEVKFDERGDGLGRYNIYNFRQVKPRIAPRIQSPSLQSNNLKTAIGETDQLPTENGSGSGSNANDSINNSFLDGAELIPESDSTLSSSSSSSSLLPISNSSLSSIGQNDNNNNNNQDQEGVPSGDASSLQVQEGAGQNNFPSQVEHIYTSNVEFEYSSIGRWTESDYYLQLNDIEFIQGDKLIPESYCSRPCELGQAKIMRAGDHCCWICKTCAPYEFLPDEFNCRDCGIGRWPIQNKTSCFDLPQKYLRWDSIYSLISLTIACLGIALTVFVSIIFIKYLDTPVVKASGRELSFILLAGIAFCHLSTFVLLSKPTTFICGSQRFLVNFGFSLMYASLLVKTNRISRIFNCARKSAKRPSFISPKSQMLITGILVAIQIFLTVIWFIFEPPGIRADSPEGKRDEVILKCRAKGKSFIISLVYNMILITTCTVYAVKTRKIPENFNESKFIGFTMYTTIVIWCAFVTMFFGTNNSYEIQINTMCVCISLSAYVTLFCLFSPKVSIILLHPDKNVRKLTMNSATYKRPFKPVSSMASVDGRYNTGGGTYNGPQTDGGSGGPMSTTSNVLNLAESQAASRVQESSTVSNVVNSNSAGSNCSNSQKTPTTLSQQLTLVGACANCGAHQLTQVPSNVVANSNFSPTAMIDQDRLTNQQLASIMKPCLATTSGRSGATQSRLAGGGGCESGNIVPTMISRSSILVSSGVGNISSSSSCTNKQHQHQQGLTTTLTTTTTATTPPTTTTTSSGGTAAKVLHSKIHSTQHGGRTVDLVKCMSSDDHLLANSKHDFSGLSGCDNLSGIANNTNNNGNINNKKSILANNSATRKHISSLNRLNEIIGNSTTSSDRHCIDESISSLANDSFVNTSQENTPCNVAGHSHSNNQYFTSKGSDSMLWNQSVYSIDYCSDCCPSYCHCSCPACSSNGGDIDGNNMEATALCSHSNTACATSNTTASLHHHHHDQESDDYGLICDSLLTTQDDTSTTTGTGKYSGIHESGGNIEHVISIRRRKSEEPTHLSRAYAIAADTSGINAEQQQAQRERTYFFGTTGAKSIKDNSATTTPPAVAATKGRHNHRIYKFSRDDTHASSTTSVEAGSANGGNSSSKAKRSQTMEMRTILNEPLPGSGKLKLRQSADEETFVKNNNNNNKSSLISISSTQPAAKQQDPNISAAPIAFALKAAAASALGSVSQIAPTIQQHADAINLATSSSGGGGGGSSSSGRQYIQYASSKDKSSEMKRKNEHHHSIGAVYHNPNKATSKQSQTASTEHQTTTQPSEGRGGAIRTSLELVKSQNQKNKQANSDIYKQRHREGSCFSYHDDYEYSYGLVHSNSDSENYYYQDEDGADGDTGTSSITRDEVEDQYRAVYDDDDDKDGDGDDDYADGDDDSDDDDDGGGGYDKDNEDDHDGGDDDDDDDFEHDGRVSLNRQQQQQQHASKPDSSIVDDKHKSQTSSRKSSARASFINKESGTIRSVAAGNSRSGSSKYSKDAEIDDHRINSVAVIAATLSTGGAIVESGSSVHQTAPQTATSSGGSIHQPGTSSQQQHQQQQQQQQHHHYHRHEQ